MLQLKGKEREREREKRKREEKIREWLVRLIIHHWLFKIKEFHSMNDSLAFGEWQFQRNGFTTKMHSIKINVIYEYVD